MIARLGVIDGADWCDGYSRCNAASDSYCLGRNNKLSLLISVNEHISTYDKILNATSVFTSTSGLLRVAIRAKISKIFRSVIVTIAIGVVQYYGQAF